MMGKLVSSILEPFTGAKATRDAANRQSKSNYASTNKSKSKNQKYQNKVRQSADFEDDSDF